MNFLSPAYLFALAAVAVPILIHIFSRRRVPEVPWSSIRFLRPADRRSMVRIHLRRLLLLALRVLGIALVALAFARPVVRGSLASLFPSGASRAACILLDRSFSMGVETDGGAAFDAAKARVEEVLAGLSGGDRVSVALFDTGVEVVYDGEHDAGAILAALAGETVSWRGTDLRAATAFGRGALERSGREARELYVLSDFQRTGLGAPSAPAPQAKPVRAILVPVRAEDPANAAIEGVATPRAALHRGETAEIGIAVRNTARDREARFPIEVEASGRRVMEKEIAIGPGGNAVETAVLHADRAGWIEGVVRKRSDRLPADDARYFALRVREKANVLLVADGGAFYLEQALSPAGGESDVALSRRSAREVVSADFDRADAVVLGPGPGLEARDIALLRRFVEGGGTALVFVLPEHAGAVESLSRARPAIEFADMPQGYFTIARPERAPEFLSPFAEEDLAALARLRFRRAAFVRGARPADVLLSFSTGDPFIWRERIGEGAIVFACVDPVPEAGELVLSPFFLPLVQQMVLAAGARGAPAEGVLVGEPIPYPGGVRGEISARMPDGSVWKSAPDPGAGPEGAVLPTAREPGFVTITAGSGIAAVVAVNPDCRLESDLSYLSADEAADSLGLEHSTEAGGRDGLSAAVRAAREGKEIALPLLLAAIAAFAAELVVAQRERRGTGENHVG
ncbi:MAG: VWA domain-containing protein [Candidatus Latescibacterota bacterium]|nr:MAG: VWA domain-containing protein [Candidatus Latescibacterota bacterium]